MSDDQRKMSSAIPKLPSNPREVRTEIERIKIKKEELLGRRRMEKREVFWKIYTDNEGRFCIYLRSLP